MKIINLFTKAPKHQRFNFTPRYYDAQKEEIKEREEAIKREMAASRGEKTEDLGNYRSRIAGSFKTTNNSKGVNTNAVMLRLGILLFITLFIIGYLQWGQPVIYSLFLAVPLYLYLKFKNR